MDKVEVRNFLLGYLSKDIAKTSVVGEDVRLILRAKAGDKDAIRKIIENNIRFVVKFASRFRVQGDVFMDLIGEGVLGIMNAIRLYDVSKKVKFSSYAGIWIKHNILAYLSSNSSVRIPDRKKKIMKELKSRIVLGEDGNEVLKDLGMSLDEYERISSLNGVVCFSDLSEDFSENILPSEGGSDDRFEEEVIISIVNDKISRLSNKERFVIEHRFGLNGNSPKRLVEIAKMIGSTPEGVRYIEKNAIAKLRNMVMNELSI